MNPIGTALGMAVALAAIGTLAAVAAPRRIRVPLSGAATVAVGVSGMVAGITAVSGRHWHEDLPDLFPPAGARFAVDALSGWFITIAAGVIITTAVYGIGYLGRSDEAPGSHGAGTLPAFPAFALALLLVPAASSVSTFLWCWELMAATSLLLVLAEHRARPTVREAGLWYAVLTQSGFLLILAGLALFAARAGGESFAVLRTSSADLPPAVRDTVFLATFVGFASKAGAVPLHAWLPRAHPEAPSQVSALMSAAMVNLGGYGVIRVGLDLLHGGPTWWGLLVLVSGAASAVYGILQAAIASDLKVLLAYSTTENMGLVLIGIGAAALFAADQHAAVAALALAAALLHLVNHAAFKALGFLAAGSVLRATGTRDLDRLGGLRRRMPVTTVVFAVAGLGAAALPLGCGFTSEWVLLQALLGALSGPSLAVTVTVPLAIGAVALSAGLAVAAFVKALGVGFLARSRSDAAAGAAESPAVMLAPLLVLAAVCTGLALFPSSLATGLSRAVSATGLGGRPADAAGVTLRLNGVAASLSPLWLAAALAIMALGCLGMLRVAARSERRSGAALWDCGAGAPTARMQYTATSFAEPVQRVFDDVVAPQIDVDVTALEESAYLVERVRYAREVPDRIERRLYRPVIVTAGWIGRIGRGLGNGSVHRYLGYGFYSLVAVLIILAVVR